MQYTPTNCSKIRVSCSAEFGRRYPFAWTPMDAEFVTLARAISNTQPSQRFSYLNFLVMKIGDVVSRTRTIICPLIHASYPRKVNMECIRGDNSHRFRHLGAALALNQVLQFRVKSNGRLSVNSTIMNLSQHSCIGVLCTAEFPAKRLFEIAPGRHWKHCSVIYVYMAIIGQVPSYS